MKNDSVILILYTTLYREGGDKFALASQTLAREKSTVMPDCKMLCRAVESKKDFCDVIEAVAKQNQKIQELHFIGHSGVYGIMFGTRLWPEQFSPYEWRQMFIPFAKDASAYFHACRTSRWFAPFFARTFAVKTYGYFWYTSVSAQPHKFVWKRQFQSHDPCYIVSVAGKKSHGLLGSLGKYLGFSKFYTLQEFAATDTQPDTSYDGVAEDYAKTFVDIKVRSDEWAWIKRQMQTTSVSSLLDVGCGNGALLRELAPHLKFAAGVDASMGMVQEAKMQNSSGLPLEFHKIDGPVLPFADNSFDVVVSVLAFRYLDWDPILKEILRVLKPGGEIWVIDMVAAPVSWRDLPLFVWSKFKQQWQHLFRQDFVRYLKKMVQSQAWQKMLEYNPIRAEHEYRWYFGSRFPDAKMQLINVGWNSRMLAFRSGAVKSKTLPEQSYP